MSDKQKVISALEEVFKVSMSMHKQLLLNQFEQVVMKAEDQKTRKDILAEMMYQLTIVLDSMQDPSHLDKMLDPKRRGVIPIVQAAQMLGLYITGQTFSDASSEVMLTHKSIDQFYFTRVSKRMDELYPPMEHLVKESLRSMSDIAIQRYHDQ
jgi:hypothetical protein